MENNGNLTDGPGTASFLDLESVHARVTLHRPIQPEHAETLLATIESIDREAYNRGLEDAAKMCTKLAWRFEQSDPRHTALIDLPAHFRALKGA